MNILSTHSTWHQLTECAHRVRHYVPNRSFLHNFIKVGGLFFLFVSIHAHSDSRALPNFRNFHWYESMETVKTNEAAQFLEYRQLELNIAVDPPKPWEVEHLYFKDTLIGKPVKILYQFDRECKQLYAASYIFEEVIDSHTIDILFDAIEDKYDIELDISEYRGDLYADAELNEETTFTFSEDGLLHFHRGVSVLKYKTSNLYKFVYGWKEGKEPRCTSKEKARINVQEKL